MSYYIRRKMHKIYPLFSVKKDIKVPADKSISHRALMFSALADGKTVIKNLLRCEDTLATISCLKKVGVRIEFKNRSTVVVTGKGKYFPSPQGKLIRLYTRESGTTIRLLSGIMCGQKFSSVLIAAPSLSRRPMRRVTVPLRLMGGKIKGRKRGDEEFPPLRVEPSSSLKGITYRMPIASAQVKSAVIFASLFASGKTNIVEPFPSRDHTEKMLKEFGGRVSRKGEAIVVSSSSLKTPGTISIPGDFSSAAFFIVLGTILKDSQLSIKEVGINPTRTGLLNILRRMGAKIKITGIKRGLEPIGDITVSSSFLKATTVKKEEVPLMIDEIPVLIVSAAFARGTTVIEGLSELKVKETDRLLSMEKNLKKCGVSIKSRKVKNDWVLVIDGVGERGFDKMRPVRFRSFGDHRTAMSLAVFASATSTHHYLDDISCINKSFPDFFAILKSLRSSENSTSKI